ncbi:MAG: bifunctional acetate--CoA ligase family protein/GNAT family N-acetyltransferase [Pseudanabaena sp.]|jgi:acetyltransferase|nr:bifunctional acetate--CoA ligase family protein/GNAT family N-acetyltransferase [Pseudanabaena sp. M090S1SP2A07QC]MCA6574040.1 bifunctional acetate--CoA ligase family protein/GNAT family N-acetyltransferase [Pseudanabaena sp. M53BS1SP1A06MG]MCA6582784.1 bifunctional acetate--CoA ligase family protein/GNAT family N-acetyltransferase [Pseudanabaena sp. M34BS1SP1A06MG]MCA6593897.1 bifunctional acetate--CoA ligase family protein/GNAT family N-acetyltransferase [Pseudanabaena sp. M38BS1SP1A06MG]M
MEKFLTNQVCASDPAHDIWKKQRHPLDCIFRPRSVAVIGASEREGSVGRTLLWNLIRSPFGGTVFPVNPQRHSVLGIKSYRDIASVPEIVDLVIIATPAATVPQVIRECVAVGVKGAIIISAGFKEIGEQGAALEQEVLAEARKGGMRIIGPNCLGLMNPLAGLNATFAGTSARSGNVAFISQSGALCTSILDWSLGENVGFSAFVSIGSMLDVGWGDLIEYLGDDPHTHSIVLYMESIGNAHAFLSAAREVAMDKPIIVLKVGHTEAAAKAAASHTGALTGSDEVLNAAFRRCGVLRVHTISDLFDMAETLAKQPRPKGNRLSIVTNAGGPGAIATDALISGGGTLSELAPETIQKLNQFLPAQWSHHNPIDILGDASSDRYAQTLEVVADDPNSDAMLVILTPQAMTNPTQTAEKLKSYSKLGKPILSSWMGGAEIAAGTEILNQANIPTFPYPDTAVRLFNYMWRYTYNLKGIYETPSLPVDSDLHAPDRQLAERILTQATKSDRYLLTEYESKNLLAAYGIPTVPTEIATSDIEAVEIADRFGYPVVLKLHSEKITHKTDVGGVRLNLEDAAAVTRAFMAIAAKVRTIDPEAFLGVTVQPMVKMEGYELILGSSLDPQFGEVMLFGMGGQLVEVFKDRALALPPLNTTLAKRMMEQTRIYEALQGVRGRKAIDLAKLEQLLVNFSQLVVEQPQIREVDINPLLVSEDGMIALDARVVLHTDDDIAQRPIPAITPYPTKYVQCWQSRKGDRVTIRPIRPEDEPLMVQFHQNLSEESVYLRYAHTVKLTKRIAHERLTRICFIDYDREMVLAADYKNPETCEHEILGVARLSKSHGMNEAEFALIVSDRYHHQGLGTELLRRILEIGKEQNLEAIVGYILNSNEPMQSICRKLGFKLQPDPGEGMLKATFVL